MPKKIKKFDALIFDIDGTLWNASPASAKGWNIGLTKLGIHQEVSSAQIEKVAGNPFEECVDLLLPGIRTHVPKLFDTLNKYETEVVRSEGGKFFDGVREGIWHLAKRTKIFLVSNCQEWYMELFLHFSNFKPVLAGFDCYGLSGLPKHDMLRKLKDNHSLYNPVYIGDTSGDETAARIAGMTFIHVAWGFWKPQGSPIIVHTFRELVDFLG
jgi:phosphoglycolate phosphatase